MQPQDFFGFKSDSLKKNILPLFLGILGLILFGYGLIQFFSAFAPQDEIVFESNSSTDSSATSSAQLVVDVSGAIENPGVYRLPFESRVQDAIIMAGGLSSQADRQWISKNLNLALKVKDGIKIYIPSIGEEAKSIKSSTHSQGLGQAGITGSEAGININTASQGELEALPGIGPATSQKIIDGRPYGSIEELIDQKILTKSVFEKIKEKITVY